MEHTRFYCHTCGDWSVLCGHCGNNACNGGSGRSVFGLDCDCDEAYALLIDRDAMMALPEHPTTMVYS